MKRFSKHEIETTVKILSETRAVRKWVEGQAEAFSIDLTTEKGRKFFARESEAAARRMLRF